MTKKYYTNIYDKDLDEAIERALEQVMAENSRKTIVKRSYRPGGYFIRHPWIGLCVLVVAIVLWGVFR